MTRDEATRELFAAISSYSSHPDYRNASRDAAALERMRAALADGADWTALLGPGQRDAAFAAATCADRQPLALLLAHGVPLEHRAGYDGMLIHRAAEFGRNDVITMLVERGIAPDVSDPVTQRTPIGCARSSRHGQRAVPLLMGLMRAHGCTPAPARRGDDLLQEAVQSAVADVGAGLLPRTRAILHDAAEAFFVERSGGKSGDFLEQLAEQNDGELLGAAVAVVNRVSTAKARSKVVKAKRGEVIHHGDLEIAGDYDAVTLVVTGDLIVRGMLSHYEGRIVAVGGTLRADAVWSEGPLWVAGDVTADCDAAASNRRSPNAERPTARAWLVCLWCHVTSGLCYLVDRPSAYHSDRDPQDHDALVQWLDYRPPLPFNATRRQQQNVHESSIGGSPSNHAGPSHEKRSLCRTVTQRQHFYDRSCQQLRSIERR